MSETSEQLWRRRRADFVVEIMVGKAWVHQGRYMTLPEAVGESERALSDNSVVKSRVCEHAMTEINTVVWEDTRDPVMRIPKKMTHTGRSVACPGCQKPAPLAADGDTSWAFCGPCDRAYPVDA